MSPVLAALASRGLLASSQLICMSAIATLLDPQQQGFIAAARSLLGLQVVLELGLSGVLVQVFAHECARADSEPHRPARTGHILRFAMCWFLAVGLLMAMALIPIGLRVFSAQGESGKAWMNPWTVATTCAAVGVTLLPLQALMEGRGSVISIALLRGVQALAGAVSLAIAARFGAGPWTLVSLVAPPAAIAIIWLLILHRRSLLDSWRAAPPEPLSWRREILPFQWRIAVSWACGWAIYQFFVPALFTSQGPIVAGQMGLSMDACAGITSLGMAWVSIKAPAWGRLVAQGHYAELDRQFSAASRHALLAVCVAAGCFLTVILCLRAMQHPIAERFLPTTSLLPLVGSAVLNQGVFAMATYLRSHKREPYLLPTVAGAVLLGTWTWHAAPSYGASALAWGHLAITASIGLGWGAWIFFRCRRTWHQPPAPEAG